MRGKIVFTNAAFYTMDRRLVRAQAIAVESGKISEIGTTANLKPLRRRGFSIYDLKNHAGIPGLIDSHLHLLSLGNSFKRVNLDGVDSLEKVIEIIKAADSRIGKRKWLRGRGWNKNLWGQAFPDKTILDQITESPVALRSKDGHLLWVNSVALKMAGISGSTPDPIGGVIERYPSGEPTGILKEEAVNIVDDRIPTESPAEKKESVRLAQEHLLSLGITGAGDCDEDDDLSDI